MSITIKNLKAIARMGKADFFDFSKYLFRNGQITEEDQESGNITISGHGFTANLHIATSDYSIDIFDQHLGYSLIYDRVSKKLTSILKVDDDSELENLSKCDEGIFGLCPHNYWCKSHGTEQCRKDSYEFAGLEYPGPKN
jgi:hypothetical protein